jgi:hypothetical protein
MSHPVMNKSVLVLPLVLLLGGCSTPQAKFRRADLNHDHKLSQKEFSEGVAILVFQKYDANKDGVVTIEEWRVVEGTGNDKGFKKRDPNHDGKITLPEVKQLAATGPRFARLFEAIDANNDGYIKWVEIEEFKKAHPEFQKPAGKPATHN